VLAGSVVATFLRQPVGSGGGSARCDKLQVNRTEVGLPTVAAPPMRALTWANNTAGAVAKTVEIAKYSWDQPSVIIEVKLKTRPGRQFASGRSSVVLAAAFASAAVLLVSSLQVVRADDTATNGQTQPPVAATTPKPQAQSDLPPRDPTRAVPAVRSAGPEGYRALSKAEAQQDGLPPEIADSVMAVESGYNPAVIGGAGEIGLMQILPSTARMLGFSGTDADLAVPETNIHYGVMYLAQAWNLAHGDICTATMKYRAGHGETRFSYLSVNYCVAVRAKLVARGYPVTGVVPVATFGEASAGSAGGTTGCRRRCLGGGSVGHVNLAALNTQLSALATQVHMQAFK
jgi:soluble lytic murein transglycosylase-like protein